MPGLPLRFDADRGHGGVRSIHQPCDMRDALSDAIRNIVLPRLIAARKANCQTLAGGGPAIAGQDVAALLSHVTTADHSLSEAMLSVLRLRGVPREDILLDLFQPVAQRLGDMWLGDQCSFADVTLGVGRLQRLMRSDAMPASRRARSARPGRVLVAAFPGDQHTFGAAMIDDLFRSAGWDTVSWSGDLTANLEVIASSAPFDVIGISISDGGMTDGLKPLAERLRKAASRHLVGILAGGRAFQKSSGAPADYGVDAIVRDARTAVPTALTLLDHRVARPA
jgi:MerR family transcriptional regulator, light-induced transcriptional regulator